MVEMVMVIMTMMKMFMVVEMVEFLWCWSGWQVVCSLMSHEGT